MYQKIRNIYRLGVKELWGLLRDPMMMCLIVYSFTLNVFTGAASTPDSIDDAAIAIVDEDNSQLSIRLGDCFLPPEFHKPAYITRDQVDPALDSGDYTFVVVFPPEFEKDVIAGNCPDVQLNVDATRMSQAFTGTSYIQQILHDEVDNFLSHQTSSEESKPASLVVRNRFNPNLYQFWVGAINTVINNITMIGIILTGAALIRERENGTLEHLLVMPVTSFEIMASKIWSMAVVVLTVSILSEVFVVNGALGIPIAGSLPLFVCGVAIHLFAVTAIGIFLACIAKSMPQFGILIILVLLPMQQLSGGNTPQESMPEFIQVLMQFAPTTHFVNFSQTILFRGGGIEFVWMHFLKLFALGFGFFFLSLARFRKTVAS